MRRWVARILLALCSLLWAGPPVLAAYQVPSPPRSSFYVQDYAGVLAPETRSQINALGTKLAAKTKAQVVVVTVPSLQGEAVEDAALAILRSWGIGDKNLNNGVLLLVAMEERRSYLAVGYGLEGALPDGKVGEIQDTYLIPFFRQGQYEKGIWNTYLAVTTVVAKEYGIEWSAVPSKATRTVQKNVSWWDTAPLWQKLLVGGAVLGFFILDWLVFGGAITYFLLSAVRFGGGGGSGSDRGGGGSGGGGGAGRGW